MKHLTPDVLGLLHQIRDGQDWALLPIMADALEEAGYEDSIIIANLRRKISSIDAWTVLALVEGEAFSEAVEWLENLVERINEERDEARHLTYHDLMEGLLDNVTTGNGYVYTNFDTPDVVREDPSKMWECFFRITGMDPTTPKSKVPFRCGC